VRLACGTDAHNSREFGVFDYHRAIFARAGLTDNQASALLFTPDQCNLAP
jgi:histidinol phosphatase-like PHP family hydrolase